MPAITGDYLSRQLDLIVGQDYSGLLVSPRKNKLFRDALLKVAEDSYKGIASQKIRDEMGFLITTEKVVNITGNQFYTAPLEIVNVVVVGATGTVTTYLPHNLTAGNIITISGVTGLTPNPNGTLAVLTTPTSTTFTISTAFTVGAYVSGGIISPALTSVSDSTPIMVPDYWHLLNMKCFFSVQYYGVNMTAASNASPIVLTIDKYNTFRTGEQIVISGVLGNTNANGTRYIKKQNDFKVALYSDALLQTPIAGNANYISGGTLKKNYFNQARPLFPKTKVNSLGVATVEAPKFEHAKRLLKIYPREVPCTIINLDYIRQPDVAIDVDNTVVDLTMYYPEKVLLHIVDVASEMFTALTRDPEGMKIMQTETVQNP